MWGLTIFHVGTNKCSPQNIVMDLNNVMNTYTFMIIIIIIKTIEVATL
jgi:hypothetical protein